MSELKEVKIKIEEGTESEGCPSSAQGYCKVH